VTVQEAEYGPTDVDWLLALDELERETGPHGFSYDEAMSPEADPSNPDGSFRFIAGIPVVSPEGHRTRAGVVDYAEKARLDKLDQLRGHDIDPMNGLTMPVFKVPRRRPKPRPGHATS